jgi:ribonuclease D
MTDLIQSASELQNLIDRLRDAPEYAIDTEFHGERTYWPNLALIQVAWADGIALIDSLAVDVAPLREIFAGPGLCVMHAASQDLAILERSCGTTPAHLFDTQLAAGFLGFGTPSLASLCERILGVHLSKGDQLADWTRRPLTASMREYAAADVAYLLALRAALVQRLESRGRLSWATDECELLRTRDRARPLPEQAWWKLKGSRSLRGKARNVAQCVAAWRERTAEAQDRPPRQVLPDLALLSIAQRPPKNAQDMANVRGIERRSMGHDAIDGILLAINEGESLTREQLALPEDEPNVGVASGVAALLTTWIAQLADELDIDPALLATRADLRALLADVPDARLRTGWRHDIVAEPIRRLMHGEVAVAIAPSRDRLVLRDIAPGSTSDVPDVTARS